MNKPFYDDEGRRQFVCEGCGRLQYSRSRDGEAEAEGEAFYASVGETISEEESALVCDECNEKVTAWVKAGRPRATA